LKLTFVNEPFNCDKLIFTLKTETGSLPMQTGGNARFLYALSTNTVKNGLAVSYDLPFAGNACLSIVNCNGRSVSVRQAGLLSAGAHVETVPLAGLCPGVYFLRLKHNRISEESRFFITR
jgi:hypothetical protein